RPREVAPGIQERIERIIMRCLEKDPAGRFQSVEELAIALSTECPSNLPPPLTTFIGRTAERVQVKDLLKTSRLVSLVGTGGCGKTRLALQVASELRDGYADGVWLVELAPLTGPTLLPQTIATVLKLQEKSNQTATDAIVEFLETKSALLVFDNCEHVIE